MPAFLRDGPYHFFFYSGDGDGPPLRSKSSGTSTFPTMKPSRAGAEGKALPPRLPDELSFVLIGNDQLDPGHWDVLAISRLCGALAHSRASSEVSPAITDRQDGCHASFQRGYRAGRLSPSRACPGVLQFLLMQRGPLQNHALGAWRKTPMQGDLLTCTDQPRSFQPKSARYFENQPVWGRFIGAARTGLAQKSGERQLKLPSARPCPTTAGSRRVLRVSRCPRVSAGQRHIILRYRRL